MTIIAIPVKPVQFALIATSAYCNVFIDSQRFTPGGGIPGPRVTGEPTGGEGVRGG